jgi:hypothetical protein
MLKMFLEKNSKSTQISRRNELNKFIAALNSLNTPWIAILVIVIGTVFSVISHTYGMSGDGASGIIGAGIGLLTGQALSKSSQTSEPMPPSPTQTVPLPEPETKTTVITDTTK